MSGHIIIINHITHIRITGVQLLFIQICVVNVIEIHCIAGSTWTTADSVDKLAVDIKRLFEPYGNVKAKSKKHLVRLVLQAITVTARPLICILFSVTLVLNCLSYDRNLSRKDLFYLFDCRYQSHV